MPLYFMLHDSDRFHHVIAPALAASWSSRDLNPIARTCEDLKAELKRFVELTRIKREDLQLFRVSAGMSFRRETWRALVGEMLFCFAAEIPELPPALDVLGQLSANDPRLLEVHHGTHGLVFGGGWYRPDNAGYNDRDDVARLAAYLRSIEPDSWSTAQLGPVRDGYDDGDPSDELEFARASLASLQAMYERARANNQLIVCERI